MSNNSHHPNERLARMEERVEYLEEELDSISVKVTEMHAILMQAKGVKWAVITFSGLVGFLIGVGAFLINLKGLRSIVLAAVALGLLTSALADGPPAPRPHSHPTGEEWIMQGNHHNPISGEHCCGENDCFKLAPEDISTTSHGDYFIRSITEIVPKREVQTSMDGNYWRCRRADGKRRCFFAPPGST
jgi:hypothetical protein